MLDFLHDDGSCCGLIRSELMHESDCGELVALICLARAIQAGEGGIAGGILISSEQKLTNIIVNFAHLF